MAKLPGCFSVMLWVRCRLYRIMLSFECVHGLLRCPILWQFLSDDISYDGLWSCRAFQVVADEYRPIV